MDWLTDPQIWAALVTLTALEIVLGIDNIIFIAIVTGKLPPEQRARARNIGLTLAVVTRIMLLASLFFLSRLTAPLFSVLGEEISVRDLVLIGGGLFLLAKSTFEIHGTIEESEDTDFKVNVDNFAMVIVQILILDIVFSLDSVITAIGMADQLWVMAAAIIIAVGFMLVFAGDVSDFVHRHPTIKMLALAFLLMIGIALIGEGLDMHIPKGYLYFGMAFSFFVEMLNLRLRKRIDERGKDETG
jgi:predicted tellurium resistance membrane protein TerC